MFYRVSRDWSFDWNPGGGAWQGGTRLWNRDRRSSLLRVYRKLVESQGVIYQTPGRPGVKKGSATWEGSGGQMTRMEPRLITLVIIVQKNLLYFFFLRLCLFGEFLPSLTWAITFQIHSYSCRVSKRRTWRTFPHLRFFGASVSKEGKRKITALCSSNLWTFSHNSRMETYSHEISSEYEARREHGGFAS